MSEWLDRMASECLLFCPLVENGFLRIYSHPGYPGGPGSPEKAAVDLHDIYLLGLSVSKGARFATLDGRVPAEAVRGGSEALTVISEA